MSNKQFAETDKIRLIAIILISVVVTASGAIFSYNSIRNGELAGGILGGVIAMTILAFFLLVAVRGSRDIKEGFPVHDERSRKVMERASSRAFYVSLYLLLAVGFLSDDIIVFRDVSQAMGAAVGGMALIFGGLWIYYNKKEL